MWSGLGYYSRARNLHQRRESNCRPPRRRIPAHARSGAGASRHRTLHSCGCSEHRLRSAARGAGRQRRPRPRTPRRDSRRPPRAGSLASARRTRAETLSQPARPVTGIRRSWNSAKRSARRRSRAAEHARFRAGVSLAAREPHARNPRTSPEARSREHPHRRRDSARSRAAARYLSAIPARTTTCFSRACGSSPPLKSRATPRRSFAAHLHAVLKLDRASLHLEPLPAARHGVTFRNITLLPFLARVQRLPKLLPHSRPPAQPPRSASRVQRHAQNRRRLPLATVTNHSSHWPFRVARRPRSVPAGASIVRPWLPPRTRQRRPPLPAVQRYFEVSLFLLVATGVLAIVSTGKLDIFSVLIPSVALIYKGIRMQRGRGPEISPRVATWLVLGLFPFFPAGPVGVVARIGRRRARIRRCTPRCFPRFT